MSRKIYLVSPREPSGATWLINCFLELGIKTHRVSVPSMWREESGKFFLNPHQNILKKWLPALSIYNTFEFKQDIEIVWTHEWPIDKFKDHQIIYFIRDPRDSLFSRYKRENPDQSFAEFIGFLDPYTLLNKIDNWCLFNRSWLSHRQLKVFRFEDYKKEPHALLKCILEYLNLDFEADLVSKAIDASTFEKAAEAEKRYREENPEDEELINRGGKVGSWKEIEDCKEVISLIEDRAASLMTYFGYSESLRNDENSYLPNTNWLSFFQSVNFKLEPVGNLSNESARLLEVLSFSYLLNKDLIVKSRLRDYEVRILLNSLSEFSNNFHIETGKRLSEMNGIYEVKDRDGRLSLNNIPGFNRLMRLLNKSKSGV